MKTRLALLCALSVPAIAAAGDNDVGHTYITPMGGALRADSERLTDRWNALGGIAIGRHFSRAWSAEILLNGTKLDSDVGGPNLSMYAFSLDVLRVFNRSSSFSPYIGIGAGGIENDLTPGAAGTDAMAQASLGAFWTLWESTDGARSFALRPDFKARWDDTGSAGWLLDYIGTLGFQYSWGAPKVVSSPPPPPPPEAPPPPPPPPPPPADSDNDGVTDDRDRCPGTPPGVAVDQDGCPQKGSITLEGVNFEYNSAALTPDSLYALDSVAAGLLKYPRLRVELQGHTDSRGPDAYNLTLSQRRADAVRDYLLKAGVPATQVTARGYGEAQPVADNDTDAGRAKNRRVIMQVIDNPGDVQVQGEGEAK